MQILLGIRYPFQQMTYAELLNILYSMPKDRLEDTITIYDAENDEYYPITRTEFSDEETNDVLDKGHLFLVRD
jgi:hypothetical protein